MLFFMNQVVILLRSRQVIFGAMWLISSFFIVSRLPTLSEASIFLAAFLFLRSFAMVVNGLVDRDFDRRNERTKERPLASYSYPVYAAKGIALLFSSFFCLAALQCGIAPFLISFFLLLLVSFYSYVKRFSWLCHWVLGSIYFLIPQSIAFVMDGGFSVESNLLGLAAGSFIAGSDILYATQDALFDREEGLYSFPSRFGNDLTKRVFFIHYLVSLFFLFCIGWYSGYSIVYFLSLSFLPMSFVYVQNLEEVNRQFHLLNVATGTFVFLSFLLEYIWRIL